MRHARLIRRRILALVGAGLLAGLGAGAAGAETAAPLAAQTSNAHEVSVAVTPNNLSPAEKAWEFEVAFNTHTQALSDDLTKTAVLIDGAGKRHAPLAWKGDAPGGHHRKGVLTFAPLAPRPTAIELQIHRDGEAEPRRFRWPLR